MIEERSSEVVAVNPTGTGADSFRPPHSNVPESLHGRAKRRTPCEVIAVIGRISTGGAERGNCVRYRRVLRQCPRISRTVPVT